jgi:hypothetical protein
LKADLHVYLFRQRKKLAGSKAELRVARGSIVVGGNTPLDNVGGPRGRIAVGIVGNRNAGGAGDDDRRR